MWLYVAMVLGRLGLICRVYGGFLGGFRLLRLLEGFTYQLEGPIGPGLKRAKWTTKVP